MPKKIFTKHEKIHFCNDSKARIESSLESLRKMVKIWCRVSDQVDNMLDVGDGPHQLSESVHGFSHTFLLLSCIETRVEEGKATKKRHLELQNSERYPR